MVLHRANVLSSLQIFRIIIRILWGGRDFWCYCRFNLSLICTGTTRRGSRMFSSRSARPAQHPQVQRDSGTIHCVNVNLEVFIEIINLISRYGTVIHYIFHIMEIQTYFRSFKYNKIPWWLILLKYLEVEPEPSLRSDSCFSLRLDHTQAIPNINSWLLPN